MSNSYPFGNPVKVAVSFLDEDGVAFTPTGAVLFNIWTPDGTKTTYTYGTDAEVISDSASAFHMWVRPTTQAGTWKYEAQALDADGAIDVANNDEFEIGEDPGA